MARKKICTITSASDLVVQLLKPILFLTSPCYSLQRKYYLPLFLELV